SDISISFVARLTAPFGTCLVRCAAHGRDSVRARPPCRDPALTARNHVYGTRLRPVTAERTARTGDWRSASLSAGSSRSRDPQRGHGAPAVRVATRAIA